jgi:hypothetical protein
LGIFCFLQMRMSTEVSTKRELKHLEIRYRPSTHAEALKAAKRISGVPVALRLDLDLPQGAGFAVDAYWSDGSITSDVDSKPWRLQQPPTTHQP